jgi:HK97 family phage major capsid protein/HK97 family phage prohead protease
MKRAYSILEVRAVDDAERTIEGIASTPSIDSFNTVIEPQGAEFKLPIPVLYQHNSRQPIGWVQQAKVSDEGIRVKLQIAKAGVADFVDEAWSLIKAKLVRGLSVGFETIEENFDKKLDGFRITKWRWHELSTVTIPANQDATITAVRSVDEAILAVSGNGNPSTAVQSNRNPPAVAGKTKGKTMTVREHITALENKRAANDARMQEMLNKSAEDGVTFDDEQKEEYRKLDHEVDEIDGQLQLQRKREARLAATAKPVTPENTSNIRMAADTREGHSPVQVRSRAPKGVGIARMAIAMYHAGNNHYAAAELARRHWPDAPEVELSLRAIVEAGDTTTSGWASQLVPAAQQLQDEFLDMYRAATIINRIPNLRRVPFNVAVPIRTAAGTFQWVGEAAPKPVTQETFTSVTLTWAKAAAITVITKELAKFSRPSAEILIRDSMVATLTRFFDAHFVSTTAAVSGVSPAGILNGITAIPASGTTAAALRTDLNNMLNNFTANNVDVSNLVLVMSSSTALAISLMVTSLDVPTFTGINASGGTLVGRPVIVSEAVGNRIIALNPSDILLAEDPGVSVEVSDQATLEMDTAPAVGEQSPPTAVSVLKSMFQYNLIAIRAEQFITWARARTAAVEYISGVAYVP